MLKLLLLQEKVFTKNENEKDPYVSKDLGSI